MTTRARLVGVLVAVVAIAVVAAVAVGSGLLGGSGDRTVTGVVIRVDSTGLTEVHGFDLREDDGTVLHFEIGTLDMSPPAFNPQHLTAHQATAEPVKVTYEDQGGRLVATRLEDGD